MSKAANGVLVFKNSTSTDTLIVPIDDMEIEDSEYDAILQANNTDISGLSLTFRAVDPDQRNTLRAVIS